MNYWNQSNFEGLKAIGEHYAGRPGYEDFGRFCLLREQGLKKPAMAAVRAFVDDAAERPVAMQRGMAEELAALGFRHAEVHQLLPYPLRVWLQGVLNDWVAAAPGARRLIVGWRISAVTGRTLKPRCHWTRTMRSAVPG